MISSETDYFKESFSIGSYQGEAFSFYSFIECSFKDLTVSVIWADI